MSQTSGGATILGNYIGLNAGGSAGVPNGTDGVLLVGVSEVVVGGTSAGARNIISGNLRDGIHMEGVGITGADDNLVQGNYIGLGADGSTPVPNKADGVRISSSQGNVIGGTTAGARNVISSNGTPGASNAGVRILDDSTNNTVLGNYIGVNAAGGAARGNGRYGVRISDSNANTIGGSEAGAGNVISGNGELDSFSSGVFIVFGGSTGNRVLGNHIGTNAAGTAGVGLNQGAGVEIDQDASGNMIGGTTAASRNVISGNITGVLIRETSTGNVIQGNYVGTNANGTGPILNLSDGIVLQCPANLIGGPEDGAGNVISANNGEGVSIHSNDNLVQGNLVGTSAGGAAPLGNRFAGVSVGIASDNTIVDNTIAYDGFSEIEDRPGIHVAFGSGNDIRENSIHSNAGLGIELTEGSDPILGVTPNDADDVDSGGNNLQNFPELTAAQAGSLTISGTFNSTPNTDFRLEFFLNDECDDSGHGEGQDFIGSVDVTTDANGDSNFNAGSNVSAVANQGVTATATVRLGPDDFGDTSEFSNCVLVQGAPTPTPTPPPTPTPTGQLPTPTPTPANGATPTPTGGTPTATPTPSPSGEPGELIQGDVDCDGHSDAVDALKQLRHVVDLSVAQNEPCPNIGEPVASIMGDVDCDDDVDSVDALKVLRHVVDLPVPQNEPCPDIGDPL